MKHFEREPEINNMNYKQKPSRRKAFGPDVFITDFRFFEYFCPNSVDVLVNLYVWLQIIYLFV